jgi:NitT/TauT family transport system ATP-binding protein
MDEPFGALDEQTRRHLGFEMASMLSQSKSTIVLVTHSLDEAILWADRVIVLSARPGQIMREIRIPSPRPRHADAMLEPWFSEIRTELFELLEGGLAAPSASTQDAPREIVDKADSARGQEIGR